MAMEYVQRKMSLQTKNLYEVFGVSKDKAYALFE